MSRGFLISVFLSQDRPATIALLRQRTHTVWGPWASGFPVLKLVEGSLAGRWGSIHIGLCCLVPFPGDRCCSQTLIQPIAQGLEFFTGQNFVVVSAVTPLTVWSQESAHRRLLLQSPRCPIARVPPAAAAAPDTSFLHIFPSLGLGFSTYI